MAINSSGVLRECLPRPPQTCSPSSFCERRQPPLQRADHRRGDAARMPVHAHHGAERLEPERIGEPAAGTRRGHIRRTIASAITAPSFAMRPASHSGTRPPWSGRSALPARWVIVQETTTEQIGNKAAVSADSTARCFQIDLYATGAVGARCRTSSFPTRRRSTRSPALLATRLTEAGYEVWWDDALLAGERFEDEITDVLDGSGLVVILWSKQSVTSDWVKAEAETARQQKKALPVIIDDMPASKMPPALPRHARRPARRDGRARPSIRATSNSWARSASGSAAPRVRSSASRKAEAKLRGKRRRRQGDAGARRRDAARPPKHLRPPQRRHQRRLFGPPRSRSWDQARRPFAMDTGRARLAVRARRERRRSLHADEYGLSADDETRIKRCIDWALSPKVTWNTTLAALEPTTADDCARAAEALPRQRHLCTGMLAMVRIAEGGDKDRRGDRARQPRHREERRYRATMRSASCTNAASASPSTT